MHIDIVKMKNGSYRIISKCSRKHPVLNIMANHFKQTNQYSEIKVGVFAVTGKECSGFKNVYSYISGKTEKMNAKNYYKWLNGKRQMKGKRIIKDFNKEVEAFMEEIG